MNRKIFVIGFNKTATSSFHELFLSNGLKSQHEGVWQTDKYDCFSDNPELNNYKELYKNYPNSIFILNTRGLNSWLLSRAMHCQYHKQTWGYPLTKKIVSEWIDKRYEEYVEILNFFKDTPKKLIIVNIEKDDWLQFVMDKLVLKKSPDKKYNTAKKISSKQKKEFENIILETLLDKNIPKKYHNDILIDKEINRDNNLKNLINNYLNNL